MEPVMTHPIHTFTIRLDATHSDKWLALFYDEIVSANENGHRPASFEQHGNRFHLELYGIITTGVHRWEAMILWRRSAAFHPALYTQPLPQVS
jgi:hypothetical protein